MSYWIKLSAGLFFVWVLSCLGSEGAGDCVVPDLLDGQQTYNRYVCAGVVLMEEQKFDEAAKSFEKALSVHLFETPNFELLPRLALAYANAGNLKKAEYILEKAKLSLSVFSGILECEEARDVFYLRKKNGLRIVGKASEEVAAIMCGAVYNYVYERQSLERVLLEANMVKRYFKIKKKIESTAKGQPVRRE